MTSRVRCSCGRVYDPQKHTTCPDCGAESAVESVVVAEKIKPPVPPKIEPEPKRDEEKKEGSFAQLLTTVPWPAYAGAAAFVLLVLFFALRPRHAQVADNGERPAPAREETSPSQGGTIPPSIPSGGATVPPTIPPGGYTIPPVLPPGGSMIPPGMPTGGVNLAELIANAAPGATVTVPAGIYPGGLVLSRAVRIVGDSHAGGQIFIQSEGRECLSVRAKGVAIQNVQFICNGIGELPAISVADGAQLEMEGCKVQSTSALGLLVSGNSSLKALGSGFSAMKGTAARITQQAEAKFTQCSFSNSQTGLALTNAVKGELHSCAFEGIGMGNSNGAVIVVAGANTQLTGDDCHVTNNSVGIDVIDAATLTLDNCAFDQNGASYGRGGGGAVLVRDAAHAAIRNTKFTDSSPYALNIIGGGNLTLEKSEISGSRTAGLVVGQENRAPAHANVKGSRFNSNATGIGVLAGSSAEIEDSECAQNNDGILVFDQGSNLKLKKAAITSNRNYGLRVYRNGEAIVVDSDIKNNGRGAQSGMPHKSAERGSLTLQDCRIGGNQVFGVGACAQSQLVLTRCVFDEESKKNIFHERGAIVQLDGSSGLTPPQEETADVTPEPEASPKSRSASRRSTNKSTHEGQDARDIHRIIRRWVFPR
jgi:Right handed beta helix region